jgi:predicted small lipoprotein YifL
MTNRVARFFPLLLACSMLALAGCGQGGPSPTKAQTAAPAEPSFQTFGAFEVHYNALRTDEIAADVARAYGIERSSNRVMLNVSLLRKNPDGSTTPIDGKVTATAYNLNGQLKDLQMRRITEGTSVYFIGEVGISGSEILVFNIEAVPIDQAEKFKVQFKREFFSG